MFPGAYYPGRFYAQRYFPQATGVPPVIPAPPVRIKPLDDKGNWSRPWLVWFEELYTRVNQR